MKEHFLCIGKKFVLLRKYIQRAAVDMSLLRIWTWWGDYPGDGLAVVEGVHHEVDLGGNELVQGEVLAVGNTT